MAIVLKKPICISLEHSVLVKDYLTSLVDAIEDVTGTNEAKFKDYLDVMNIVIEHHNGYKNHLDEQANFYDFMSIIPTNMSVMTTGFLAGIETKRNAKKVRAYRVFLNNYAFDMVERLNKLKVSND